jgi:hypothetical protein
MRVEEMALRSEIRQMLNEAGLNEITRKGGVTVRNDRESVGK